jgi:porin
LIDVSGTGNDDFKFGSKFDAFINLDSGKMGLWDGGGFRSHIEYRHGDADAYRGGAIWPVNTAQALPLGASEEIHVSSLYFTHKIDGVSSILLGKINVVDLLAANSFFWRLGKSTFHECHLCCTTKRVITACHIRRNRQYRNRARYMDYHGL